ncbi:MAG TPA: hypothetical protein VFW87_05370, partial [Pirellulales bacterium]|nr:hypothetical protein [Pirellulales bacterium]
MSPELTVRQVAADYAGCREVFARYGEADRPGVKFGHLEPIERFAARHGIAVATLLAELAGASGASTEFRGAAQRNAHRPFLAA